MTRLSFNTVLVGPDNGYYIMQQLFACEFCASFLAFSVLHCFVVVHKKGEPENVNEEILFQLCDKHIGSKDGGNTNLRSGLKTRHPTACSQAGQGQGNKLCQIALPTQYTLMMLHMCLVHRYSYLCLSSAVLLGQSLHISLCFLKQYRHSTSPNPRKQ